MDEAQRATETVEIVRLSSELANLFKVTRITDVRPKGAILKRIAQTEVATLREQVVAVGNEINALTRQVCATLSLMRCWLAGCALFLIEIFFRK